MHYPSARQSLARLGCLVGMLRPSCHQIVSTQSLPTSQPSNRSISVTVLYPYRPYSLASAMIRPRNRSRTGSGHGTYQEEDRIWPIARHALGSDTWSTVTEKRSRCRRPARRHRGVNERFWSIEEPVAWMFPFDSDTSLAVQVSTGGYLFHGLSYTARLAVRCPE